MRTLSGENGILQNQDKMKRRRAVLFTRSGAAWWWSGVTLRDGGGHRRHGKTSSRYLKKCAKETWREMENERQRKLFSWTNKASKMEVRWRKEEKIEGEKQIEDLGFCVEKTKESSDPGWLQIDCALDENSKWKINNQKFKKMIQKTQNMLDITDLKPMADHFDMFQHVYREWHEEADRLTHEARK